jgi:hypothetical protein
MSPRELWSRKFDVTEIWEDSNPFLGLSDGSDGTGEGSGDDGAEKVVAATARRRRRRRWAVGAAGVGRAGARSRHGGGEEEQIPRD